MMEVLDNKEFEICNLVMNNKYSIFKIKNSFQITNFKLKILHPYAQ